MSGILRKNPLEGYNSREQLLLQYKKYSNIWSILGDRDVLISVVLYSLHTFSQQGFDALFPNVLVNRKSMGGFEFDTKSISFITMVSSVMSFTPSKSIGVKWTCFLTI